MSGIIERMAMGWGRAVGAYRWGVSQVMERGIGQDAALARSANRLFMPGGIPADPRTPSDEQRYETSDDVYAAVGLLADCASMIPWQVTVRGEEVEDHDALALLQIGNSAQGGIDFWTRTWSWLWLLGECFIVIERDNPVAPAMPNALWATSGRYWRVKPGTGDRYIDEYRFVPPGKAEDHAIVYDPLDVIPLISFNPRDPLRGMSPLSPLRLGLDAEREAKSANRDLFRNGPMIDAVISPADGTTLTQQQREQFKDELDQKFVATGRRHRPLVPPIGVRVDQVALTPRDAEFLGLDKLTTYDVAKAYRIPPMFLGLLDHATLRNFETGYRALWELAVFPVLRRAGATLTITLGRQFGEDLVIQPHPEVMKEKLQDEKAIADTMGVLVRSGYDRLAVAQMMLGDHIDETFVSDLVPVVLQDPDQAGAANGFRTAFVPDQANNRRRAYSRAASSQPRDELLAARAVVESAAERDIRDGLQAQADRVTEALRGVWSTRDAAGDMTAVVFPEWTDDPMADALAGVLANGVDAGAEATSVVYGITVDYNAVSDESRSFAAEHVGREVRHVNDTTRGYIQQAIADGLAAQDNLKQIEARIVEAFGLAGEDDELNRYRNRARTIAETEVAASYNHGSNHAIEAAGLRREWLWSGLAKDTRHDDIDGQTRGAGEAFDVHGYSARYPGDPVLPAGERINCKCSLGVAEEDDDA